MSTVDRDLEHAVLSLPPEARARILERLIASFESGPDAQQAWLSLADARREQVRSGAITMVPAEDALDRVRARIA